MTFEFDTMTFLARFSDAIGRNFYLRTFDHRLEDLASDDVHTLRIAIATEKTKEVTINGAPYLIKARWENEHEDRIFGIHVKLEEVTK